MDWRFWKWKQRDNDVNDEIAHDLAAEAEERMRAGIPREEAEFASRRDFGNVSVLKEDIREVCVGASLQGLVPRCWIRLAYDGLESSFHGYGCALAGVGNRREYSDLQRDRCHDAAGDVVRDHSGPNYPVAGGGVESPDFPWQAYELFRDRNTCFSTLFAHKDAGRLNLMVNGQAEAGALEYVTGNFFSGTGVNPAAGRLLTEGDNRPNSWRVAVISYDYWLHRFNGDQSAIGQTIHLNNVPFTIAGVAAPEFFGVTGGSAPLIYVPMSSRLTLYSSS